MIRHELEALLQGALDDWVSDWLVRGFAADPYRNTTDLGSVGRLKLVDAIVLRAYASDEEAPRLKLLHSASFNTLHGTTWLARQSPLAPVEPQADGTTWDLVAGAAGSPPGRSWPPSVSHRTRVSGGRRGPGVRRGLTGCTPAP